MPKNPATFRPVGCAGPVFGQDRARAESDARRGSAHRRGYTAAWARYSRRRLIEHPLCVRCLAQGEVTPATVTDHVRPWRGDGRLFWDPANHQSLCKPCHDRKTAREDRRTLNEGRPGGRRWRGGGVVK